MNQNFLNMLQMAGGNPEVQELQKALVLQPGVAGVNAAGTIDTWKREFVSDLVSSLLAEKEDLQFTNLLAVDYSKSHFYQYNRKTVLGDEDLFGTHGTQTDFTELAYPGWDRNGTVLKFAMDKKQITMAAQSDSYYHDLQANPYNTLAEQALLAMLLRQNKTFMRGDERIDPLQVTGILAGHQYRNGAYLSPSDYSALEEVIDMRGQPLDYDTISKADNILYNHLARNKRRALIMPSISLEGISSKDFGATPFRVITSDKLNDKPIYDDYLAAIRTKSGRQVIFKNDLFVSRERAYGVWKIGDTNQTIHATAPATPNVTSGTNSAVVDASSKFASTDVGSYYYAVSAVGQTGVSKLALINATPVTMPAAGYAVDLKFSSGSGTYAESGYIIWRSEKNAAASTGLFYPLFTVTTADLATGYDGGTAVIRDRNRFLPGCEECVMVGMDNTADLIDKEVLRRIELRSSWLDGIMRQDVPFGFLGVPSFTTFLYTAYGFAQPLPTKVLIFRNVKPKV